MLPPTNDDCNAATTLTVNAGCTNGTTEFGITQLGESTTPGCVTNAFSQTVWYRFTATAPSMFVQLNVTGYGGSGATWGPANWACVVYRSSATLPPTAGNVISCINTNSRGTGDGVITNNLTGLTVGSVYLVQVGYSTGQGANSIPNFCIRVGDRYINCNTCNAPCGPACGFSTSPTVAQVTSSCPSYTQFPLLEGTVADTQCYTFTAVNSTVSFNVILNSTCGSGNVTNFAWNLYSSNCGNPIQTGTLSNLTFNSLIPGQRYTYCYSFAVPSGCYHSIHYPYFVGAAPVLLPVELLHFDAEEIPAGVRLHWSTASETNNERFIIERSSNGFDFTEIGSVAGNGTTSELSEYEFLDLDPISGIIYYRLHQVDFDGQREIHTPVAIKIGKQVARIELYPNPSKGLPNISLIAPSGSVALKWSIIDPIGNLIQTGEYFSDGGTYPLQLDSKLFSSGSYLLKATIGNETISRRFAIID
ncbi:MAG: T9SS type A sorting domain-containing protein [Bacteroidota bacterium]